MSEIKNEKQNEPAPEPTLEELEKNRAVMRDVLLRVCRSEAAEINIWCNHESIVDKFMALMEELFESGVVNQTSIQGDVETVVVLFTVYFGGWTQHRIQGD